MLRKGIFLKKPRERGTRMSTYFSFMSPGQRVAPMDHKSATWVEVSLKNDRHLPRWSEAHKKRRQEEQPLDDWPSAFPILPICVKARFCTLASLFV